MRISSGGIRNSGVGNETVSAELLEAVVLSDNYVRSLEAGDRISLKKYGLDDEIIVAGPIGGFADEVELVLSSDTAIVDGLTSVMETGELRDRKLSSLRAFFDQNPGKRDVIVTIAGGRATRVYIPYTPM